YAGQHDRVDSASAANRRRHGDAGSRLDGSRGTRHCNVPLHIEIDVEMQRAKHIVLKTIAVVIVAELIGVAVLVASGVYDISATDQHTKPVYWLIELTMQRSVQLRAHETETPNLQRSDLIDKG